MSKRLGWLGPAIVIVGIAVAALGAWYVMHARPSVGDVIDEIEILPSTRVVVRGEAGGDRAFVELYEDGELKWQAFVPPYGGHRGAPGIAISKTAVSVRVIRDGRAEVFALARDTASKLGGFVLAPEHGPIDPAAPGPVTLFDFVRSYELVAGRDWHQLVGIDLTTGKGLWKTELGPAPVTAAGVKDGLVWVVQGQIRRSFQVLDGIEAPADKPM